MDDIFQFYRNVLQSCRVGSNPYEKSQERGIFKKVLHNRGDNWKYLCNLYRRRTSGFKSHHLSLTSLSFAALGLLAKFRENMKFKYRQHNINFVCHSFSVERHSWWSKYPVV